MKVNWGGGPVRPVFRPICRHGTDLGRSESAATATTTGINVNPMAACSYVPLASRASEKATGPSADDATTRNVDAP